MKKILTALMFSAAALLPLTAQQNTVQLEKIAQQIPHYANVSVGVIEPGKFDVRSPMFKDIMDFMDADDILKDLKISAGDVRVMAFGKEDQRHGDAEYAVVYLKRPEAKAVLDKLDPRRGPVNRVIFDKGEKLADMIAPDQIYFTEMDLSLQNAPRTLELRRNILSGTFPAEKDGLAVHFIRRFKDCSMVLTIKSVIGRIPCYELKASYSGKDTAQIQRRLDDNLKDELTDEGMASVVKRLHIANDPKQKCITVTAQIAAWRPEEFEALLDALEMDDDD